MTWTRRAKGLVAGGTPRVNLLPPQEVENRGRQTLRMQWLKVFIAALLLVAMAWVFGFRWSFLAEGALDAADRDSAQLQSQLAGYSEVLDLRAEVRRLQDLRTQAGGNDQDWRPLIAEIKAVLPQKVRLIGFKLAPGAARLSGADPSDDVGLKGTLTFSAGATSAQAETITRLRTLHGFIDVDASELSSDDPAGGVTFVITVSADQSRYTRRFEPIGSK